MVLIAMAIVSCNRDIATMETLSHAEAIMQEHPDSALSLLQAIDTKTISTDRCRALHALLLSQAYDKNYIDLTNDSIITIAVDYFADSEEHHYAMLAHYYHGRIRYNAADYPRCLFSMTKAFIHAEDINDYYWKGRIAEQISNVYDSNFHEKEAVYYAQIAYENLKISGMQPYLNYSLLRLARVQNNNGSFQNCIDICKQLIDSAKIYNDSRLFDHSRYLMAKAYYGNGEYKNAKDLIIEIGKNGELETDLRCFLGLSHIELRELDNAKAVFNSIGTEYCDNDLSLVYEISKRTGATKDALSALSKLYDNLDSVFVYSMSQNFNQTLSELHQQEQKTKEAELNSAKLSRNTILSIGIVVIITITMLSYKWNRKYKQKLEKNIIIAQNLREILQTNASETQHIIDNLLASRFEVIDNLCKTLYENKSTGLAKKKISSEVEKLIEQFSSDNQKIAELEIFANKHHSNIIASFKADLPNLKEADYLLFLYTTLGFSITAIAIFLNEEKVDAIYNRKARLKNKIRKLGVAKYSIYSKFI